MRNVQDARGEMQDFVSKIEFALNFEDHRDSVKVRVGEVVQYDGLIAKYVTNTGREVVGRTPSLRAAINNNWLELKSTGKAASKKTATKKTASKKDSKESAYDGLKGGDFDEYVKQNIFSSEVVKEENLIVKSTDFEVSVEDGGTRKSEKLEVAGDQVAVKEISDHATMVSSSTSIPRKRTPSTKVIQSEDYGADSTQPMQTKRSKAASAASAPPKKKKSYTVDASTPALQEGATKEEIARAKGVVVDAEESQDAQVVRPIKGLSTTERTVDGITMRKTKSSGDVQDRRVVKKIGKSSPNVTVSPGSEPIVDVSEGGEGIKVVAKTSKAKASPPNYLEMMPDDWAKLHWVRKEKFIKGLDDPDFIRFILRVETVNAVQKACKARLEELEQKASG